MSIADASTYFQPAVSGKAPTIATLTVVSGPDAGREFPLTAGTTVLGREDAADITLHDPLVSKRHVRFEVSSVVEVVDLGSANGVVVDGGIVTRLRIDKAETLLIGDSEICITVVDSAVLTGVAPTAGPIFFNRSPKVERRYAGQEFAGPAVPAEKQDQPFPLLAMIAPILMGGAMFYISRQPSSLLFIAMSPIMLVGNFFTGKTREKRRLKKAIGKFDVHQASLTTQLEEERVKELELRINESPSTEDSFAQAIRRGPLLWTRRPEHWSFLNVRIGIGMMASRNIVSTQAKGEMLPEFQSRLDTVVEENRLIAGVPIIDNLFDSGALGIAGPTSATVGSVNSVLIQITALHSPAELVVAALVSPAWSRELEWLKWMPQCLVRFDLQGDR